MKKILIKKILMNNILMKKILMKKTRKTTITQILKIIFEACKKYLCKIFCYV